MIALAEHVDPMKHGTSPNRLDGCVKGKVVPVLN
jgi:hypothetical protein